MRIRREFVGSSEVSDVYEMSDDNPVAHLLHLGQTSVEITRQSGLTIRFTKENQ